MKHLTPEEILVYQPSPEEQARVEELTRKNKSDTLSKSEEAELQQFVELELTFSILKAKAVVSLNKNTQNGLW